MTLDRSAFAVQFGLVGTYLRGTSPLLLSPAVGGSPIPYRHDEESQGAESTEAGGRADDELAIYTAAALTVRGVYETEDGRDWTVQSCEPVQGGVYSHAHRSVLVSHAR
jgi:hypothetical protein